MKTIKHFAVAVIGAIALASSSALAAPYCPHNPNALGTSRTITVSPADYPLVGKEQYLETLPLQDREVVLTFDDGPIPATTPRILDALAAECAKATFFMLGKNVAEAPDLARRAYDEGHAIGTHTFSHQALAKLSLARAQQEVDLGIEAVTEGLGKGRRIAPFFRAPYLSISKEVERYILSRGHAVWSIDADSTDWTFTTPDRVIERSINELERVGKGMLLLHDIKPGTARAMPNLLQQLKARGFRLVHVMPPSPFRSSSAAATR
jgi:peptidoglycan/xylan/chitin deacetylase (PgdA/CDA1 family)